MSLVSGQVSEMFLLRGGRGKTQPEARGFWENQSSPRCCGERITSSQSLGSGLMVHPKEQ